MFFHMSSNYMTINQKIKKEIVSLLAKQKVEIEIEDLNTPPSPEMGDLALPCFKLAKQLKKSPDEVAKELAQTIKPSSLIINLKNTGAYLNFLFDYEQVSELVFTQISKQKIKYGQNKNGKGKKIMIEYSQPNTHKEFHVGHLRNAALGSALVNIYLANGYKVIAANYFGDTGAHVAKTLWYYQNFVNESDIKVADQGRLLGQMYPKAITKIDENTDYKNQVADIYKKLETGDPQLTKLWQKTRKWSLDLFDQIYQELGIKFDVKFYESEEEKAGKKMLPQLLKHDFIKKSEGAIIADLEKYNLGVLVLVRKDGTTLYGIKDIPLGIKKFKKYKLDKSIYVVDNRQSQYLQQIFRILELIGYKKEMTHVAYEFVQLKSGIMASRTGNVVTYDEVRRAALNKVIKETKQRHEDWDDQKIEEVSLKIVLAALKFGMLKSNNNKIITFDLEEALDVNGFSGPYLQYTMARINSILKKSGKVKAQVDYKALETNIEKKLIKDMLNYGQAIEESLKTNDPSGMIQYLYNLAQNFNTFYHDLPVLKAPANIQIARLALINSVKQVLNNGMDLLGLPILDEM